jgi:two-component system chemotaxis response regulator CheY
MGKKILIVDDSIYMRSLIRSALEEAGYEIIGEAKDGETAIDLAMETSPDLITLDNILPDMMGFEVLRQSSIKVRNWVQLIILLSLLHPKLSLM